MSTFLGLETMRRAVGANRSALQTVGNNIANAGTPGYSRQRVNLQATGGYPGVGTFGQPAISGRLGTGVEVKGVQRIRDQFLDRQFRSEVHIEGAAFMQHRTLERLEDLYNEAPTNSDLPSGLSGQLSAFWNGWKDLASGQENQAVLVEQGKAISDTFSHLHSAFETELENLAQEFELTEKKMADLLKQIEINNQTIAKAERGGQVPNELYDEQDRLLDELAVLVPIQVNRTESSPGIAKGAEGIYVVEILETSTGGGELAGIEKAIERVEKEVEKLKELANLFVDEVNNRYSGGEEPEFFIFDQETGLFQMNQQFVDDPSSIDQTAAEAIGKMADDGEVMKMYRDMMGQLAVEASAMRRETESSNARLANIEGNRMSMSGVSLDEELAMLIQYQHSYNAAARAMTAMDEMLNTIINGMGVVGR